jgi:Glycosyl hydrolase family 26
MKHRRRNRAGSRVRPNWLTSGVAVIAVATTTVVVGLHVIFTHPGSPWHPLPTRSMSYLGLYERNAIWSYAPIDRVARDIGRQPNIVSYYSAWRQPFEMRFATWAAEHGAVPLVQIDPTDISLAAIASGHYDGYLRAYASTVLSYHRPVILSFGHEMNGWWYSWAYRHTSPATFVAAWRHIVTVFRAEGAGNVTWLWTINVINPRVPGTVPGLWWPGKAYVTWVGIDGYYFQSSWKFAPLFGPTIKAVRALTRDPILIAETGAPPVSGQPAKIADLFAGIRAYGLLGFVWFDVHKGYDWRLSSPSAIAAFRRGARTFRKPAL